MRSLVLFLAVLTLVAGCGGANNARAAQEAAQAFYDVAKKDLSEPPTGAATGRRFGACGPLIDDAPPGGRWDTRPTAPVIRAAASLSSLPATYHRFATDLGKVDVHGDRGLIAIRREVDALDTS